MGPSIGRVHEVLLEPKCSGRYTSERSSDAVDAHPTLRSKFQLSIFQVSHHKKFHSPHLFRHLSKFCHTPLDLPPQCICAPERFCCVCVSPAPRVTHYNLPVAAINQSHKEGERGKEELSDEIILVFKFSLSSATNFQISFRRSDQIRLFENLHNSPRTNIQTF